MKNERPNPARTLLTFFLITFAFSWLLWLPGVLASNNLFSLPFPNMVLVIIGAHGPLVAAFFLTYRLGGWAAVKRLLAAGFNLRLRWVWWLAVLLLPVILSGLALWVSIQRGGFQPELILLSQPWLIIPTFLGLFFLGGSFQEEFGWRGFALPRLLKYWNPLAASLVLGTVWAFWHLPLFFIAGTGQVFMPFVPFLVLSIAFSILFTWFYLRTGKNLFSALLFHAVINTSFSLFPPVEQTAGGDQTAFLYLVVLFVLTAMAVVIVEHSLLLKKSETEVQ